MSRADMTHDLIESQYGQLPDVPVHAPVLRPDSRRSDIPLKTPRVQVDLPRRISEQAWLRGPVESHTRPQPASLSPESEAGGTAVVAVCVVVLISIGAMAVLGQVSGVDLLGYLLKGLQ